MENFFISSIFFLACIGSLLIYYLPFSRRLQIPLLICVSLGIYWLAAGNLIFLLLFCCVNTAIFSYGAAYAAIKWRKKMMITGIIINISLLVFFKYKRLFIPSTLFAGWFGNDPVWMGIYQLALPIGISFYVFHGLSLMIDSYLNPVLLKTSEHSFLKHLQKTMLYLVFFPQLVAGPIAKGKFFYTQIKPKLFANIDWTNALRALVQGYFLKEVIANNLNQLTAPLSYPEAWAHTASNELLWMVIGYSAQIFADFAGYSLIAIGLGRLYGYELPINFNCPYFAHSFSNFWTRWHISLSSWLRDYLYIPLGGNRISAMRTYANLMIVMAIGGLWHGPEWKYVTWGLLHGSALAIERLLSGRLQFITIYLPTILQAVIQVLRILFVFAFVTFAWLFFRLNSVQEVITFVQHVQAWRMVYTPSHQASLLLLYIFSGTIFAYHLLNSGVLSTMTLRLKRYDGYLAGLLLVLCLIAKGKENAFIYFQF